MRRPVLVALCDLLSLSFIRGVRRVFAPRGFKKSGLSKLPLRLGQVGPSGRGGGWKKPPSRGIPAWWERACACVREPRACHAPSTGGVQGNASAHIRTRYPHRHTQHVFRNARRALSEDGDAPPPVLLLVTVSLPEKVRGSARTDKTTSRRCPDASEILALGMGRRHKKGAGDQRSRWSKPTLLPPR
jgi:hypothetical protein